MSDLRAMGSRLVAHLRSRSDCTEDAAPPPGGGGSGHLLFAVGGIDSRTDPVTGATFALDTAGLGYRSGEVGWFSYRRDGGAYRPVHTYGDLLQAAFSLRDQLRVFARADPGREVDLVAHSQGGVVVDAFLEVVDDPADPGLPPLGTVLTLASPHQGAPLAAVATELRSGVNGRRVLTAIDTAAGGAIPPSSGRSTRQLAPGSALMRRLAAAPLPDGIDLTSLGGVDDVVVPATATDKRGAGGHHESRRPRRPLGDPAGPAGDRRRAPCVGAACSAVRGLGRRRARRGRARVDSARRAVRRHRRAPCARSARRRVADPPARPLDTEVSP